MGQVQSQVKAADTTFAKRDEALRGPGYDDSWLRTTGGGREQEIVKDPNTGENVALSNAG